MKKLLSVICILLSLQNSYGTYSPKKDIVDSPFFRKHATQAIPLPKTVGFPLFGTHRIQNIPLTKIDKALIYGTPVLTGALSYAILNHGLDVQPQISLKTSLLVGILSCSVGYIFYRNTNHAQVEALSNSLKDIKGNGLQTIEKIYEKISAPSTITRQNSYTAFTDLEKAFESKETIMTAETMISVISTVMHYENIIRQANAKVKDRNFVTTNNIPLSTLFTETAQRIDTVKKHLEEKLKIFNSEEEDPSKPTEELLITNKGEEVVTLTRLDSSPPLTKKALAEHNANTNNTPQKEPQNADIESVSSYHTARN